MTLVYWGCHLMTFVNLKGCCLLALVAYRVFRSVPYRVFVLQNIQLGFSKKCELKLAVS